MFKLASTAAMAALITSSALTSAFAAGAVLKGGQFSGVTQYTNLVDPAGLCASQAGLATGQLTSAVATVKGLGTAWTETIANSNPSPTSQYGVSWINCSFPALPAATSFVKTQVGTSTPAVYEYVSSPTTPQVTSCLASTGTAYTLTAGNDTLPNGLAQTVAITVIPVNTGGLDYGFKLTSTNSALSVAPYGTICYLSTDALYLNTSK
jgi:hypothetical protein